MKIGYIIANKKIIEQKKRIGYLYREEPDNDNDSGWRIFSGEETQEYADEASNFAMYNASTVVELHPEIADLLAYDYPVSFERDEGNDKFVRSEDDTEK